MTNPRNPTIYTPLGDNSIRLLQIKPGFTTETIECSFVTVEDINHAPPYEALSYVWGTDTCPTPILCNGIETSVTQSLADALQHLRALPSWDSVILWDDTHPLHSSRNVWRDFAKNRNEQRRDSADQPTAAQEQMLWVDAICINQDDWDERARQVKMMGRIYAQASSVKIWLGKEMPAAAYTSAGAGSHGPMPVVLTFLAQALRNANLQRNRLAKIAPAGDTAHRNVAFGLPAKSAPQWDVLRQFLANQWFQRVWVVQEVVLSRQATVLLGDWEIGWAAMGRATQWFREEGYALPPVLKYELPALEDYLPVARAADTWVMSCVPEKRLPLLDLLRNFRDRQAKHAVDKVYGTFGLAIESRQFPLHPLIEPDYTKSVVTVYTNLARYLILEHGHLAVLSHAGLNPSQSDWPSWVPQWHLEKASVEFDRARVKNQDRESYHAGGNEPLTMGIHLNDDTLPLEGLDMDRITAYGDGLVSYGFGYVTYGEEREFVEAAWNMVEKHPRSGEPSSSIRLFVETLVAKRYDDEDDDNHEGSGDEDSNGAQKPGSSFPDDARAWLKRHLKDRTPFESLRPAAEGASRWLRKFRDAWEKGDEGRFHEAFVRACTDRRFFVTEKGRMGIGPETIKEGDRVVVLFGGSVPYVMRPLGVDGRFRLVGECYVSGLMEGEAVGLWKDGRCERAVMELI